MKVFQSVKHAVNTCGIMLLRLQALHTRPTRLTTRVYERRHPDHICSLHHRRLNRLTRYASKQIDARVSDDAIENEEEYGDYCMPSDITVDNDSHDQFTVLVI